MAFIVNETEIQQLGGNKGLSILFCTYTNTAGSTGGTLTPGYAVGGGTALADAKQIRRIKAVIPIPGNTAGNAPIAAAPTFDSVSQADNVVLTTVADQDGQLMIIGESWGS